jgi:hypothetical protein
MFHLSIYFISSMKWCFIYTFPQRLCRFAYTFLFVLLSDSEDGDSTLLRNLGKLLPDNMALCPSRCYSHISHMIFSVVEPNKICRVDFPVFSQRKFTKYFCCEIRQ